MSSARQWRRRSRREASASGGNYLPDLLALAPRVTGRPGVHHVNVFHDDDCAYWRGGTCDCRPEVRLVGDPRDN